MSNADREDRRADQIERAAKSGRFWFAFLVGGFLAVASGTATVTVKSVRSAEAKKLEEHDRAITELQAYRASDLLLLQYMCKRVDGIGYQLNEVALSGRIPFIPAPTLPATSPAASKEK